MIGHKNVTFYKFTGTLFRKNFPWSLWYGLTSGPNTCSCTSCVEEKERALGHGAYDNKCTLLLTSEDSAKSLVVAALSVIGQVMVSG